MKRQRNLHQVLRPAGLVLLLMLSVGLARGQMPSQFTTNITNGANVITVDYLYHPIRGANFGVFIQDASSNFVAYASPLPPAGTYIGTVQGYPGATACALLQTNGTLWEYVIFEAGDQWWADNGAVRSTYGNPNFTPKWPTSAVVSPSQAAVVTNVVAGDIIADIPYNTFTSRHGSSVDHALLVTEFCLMQTDLVYVRDIGFLHRLSRVFIRGTQATDPYQSGNVLNTIRNQFTFIGHECLKFVATVNYGGGVALYGTVGDNFSGAAVADVDGRGDAYIVWRHEVGHNHGAGDGQGGYCENYTLMNANQVGRLAGPEEAAMLKSRHGGPVYGADVMENMGAYPFPIPPRASLDIAYGQPSVPVTIDVMANDHDVNNQAFTLLSFDTNSTRGGTITRSVGTGPGGRDQILFTPANDPAGGLDNFHYWVQDSAGQRALGNVYVQVSLAPGDELAHWPLDDAAGANAQEVVARADAIATNGVSWTSGRFNGAAQFNGVNQYWLASLSVSETSYAVSLWFRTTQASGGIYVVTEPGGGWDRSLSLSGGNIRAYVYNAETITSTGLNLADGQWHHVVHTFGGSVGGQKVYVDGVLRASGTRSLSNFNWDALVKIGHSLSGGYFNGAIDDVRIFRRALAANEAVALYQGGGPAGQPEPPNGSLVSGGNSVDLSWFPPGAGTGHDLYLGTNYASVLNATTASPEFVGTLAAPNYTAAVVSNLFYWRVQERSSNNVAFNGVPWYFHYVDDPVSYTFDDSLSGGAAVIQNGPGNLILSGSGIIHTGPTRLRNGTLTLSAANAFNSPILIGTNGTLVLDGTGGSYNSLSQPISGGGAAPVTVNSGTQWSYLKADNTYTNATLINAGGLLSLGNNTDGGSVLGTITNHGTLGINRTADAIFTNRVAGTGSLNLYNTNIVSSPSITQAYLNGYSGTLRNTTVVLSSGLKFGNGIGGGGLTITDGADVTVTGGGDNALRVLPNSFNDQALNISGGTLTALSGYFQDDWDTAYTVTQSGGVVNIAGMRSTGYWGGWGRNNSYTLTGGTLILGASGILKDYYGLLVYLGGGTLSASADTYLNATVQFTGDGGDLTVDTAGRNISFNSGVTGAGGVIKTGAGTMTFSSASTYSGATAINGGTLKLYRSGGTINNSPVSANTNGTVLLDSNGATWAPGFTNITLNGGTLAMTANQGSARYITGVGVTNTAGASSFITIHANSAGSPNASCFFLDNGLIGSGTVTMSSDTAGIGVVLRNASTSFSGTLIVNGNATTTSGAGSGLSLGAFSGQPALVNANLSVNGTLELGNAGMGWANDTVSGQTIQMGALSGSGVVVANMTTAGSTRGLSLGNNNSDGTFSGVIANGANDVLSVIKNGSGTQTLSGPNTYTGTTTVSNGTLLVNGSLASGSSVIVAPGGTLGGIGTLRGPVAVSGTLAPGSGGIGKLTLTNSPLLNGRVLMEISKGAVPNADKLVVTNQPLAYAGTLTVTNIGANALAAGDTFTLFSTVSFSGNFTATNLPSLASGLRWVWTPANGTLSVISAVNTTPANITHSVSDAQLTLSWPADHLGWKLQCQTNSLTTGLDTNWTTIPGSELVTSTNWAINPANPTVFFRLKYP